MSSIYPSMMFSWHVAMNLNLHHCSCEEKSWNVTEFLVRWFTRKPTSPAGQSYGSYFPSYIRAILRNIIYYLPPLFIVCHLFVALVSHWLSEMQYVWMSVCYSMFSYYLYRFFLFDLPLRALILQWNWFYLQVGLLKFIDAIFLQVNWWFFNNAHINWCLYHFMDGTN